MAELSTESTPPPIHAVQIAQLLQSVRRYLAEIRDAIGVQIPLNADQILYEVQLEIKLRNTIRQRHDVLVSGVCRRASSRLAGIDHTLAEVERLQQKLYPVNNKE